MPGASGKGVCEGTMGHHECNPVRESYDSMLLASRVERPNNSALTRPLPGFAFSRPQEVLILANNKIEPCIAGLDRAFFPESAQHWLLDRMAERARCD